MSSEFARARLSEDLEQALRPMMTPRVFSKGATLYREGTFAAGIYLVETGSVRLLLTAPAHLSQLLEVARPGTILGLSESLSGERYRVTVEAEEQTTAAFVARKGFMELLHGNQEFCMQVVRLLSENLHGLYRLFRNVSAHPGRPRRRALNETLN
jgi:CRP-like cAMP-binding protein